MPVRIPHKVEAAFSYVHIPVQHLKQSCCKPTLSFPGDISNDHRNRVSFTSLQLLGFLGGQVTLYEGG